MNITKAYTGALDGLKPYCYDGRTRKAQIDICTQLAMLRRAKYHVQDSSAVTAADLARLKDRGEVRLK